MPETQVTPTGAAPAPAPTEGTPQTPPEGAAPQPGEGGEPKQEEKFASKFAALSRKEKALLEREKSIKEQSSKFEKFGSLLETAKENPLALLEEAGLTFDDLANYVLSQGKEKDPASEVMKRLEALESQRAEDQKRAEQKELDRQKAYVEKAITEYRKDLDGYIAANPDDYELILANNAQDDVWEVVEEYFYETGEILAPEQAAKQVEDYLVAEAEKLLKSKKLASRFSPKEATPDAQKANSNGQGNSPKITLTNSQTLPAGEKPSGPLSKEERMKRALEKLQFRQ